MTDTITKEERKNALDWTRIKLTSGNISADYYSSVVCKYEAALSAAEKRIEELEAVHYSVMNTCGKNCQRP